MYCVLFTSICLLIFLVEYIYIDHAYHVAESARHAQTSALLTSAQSDLEAAAAELETSASVVHEHERRIDELSHQLSQRDDALLMYRQLVTDLQEKSAATEAEQALTLQQAQLQAQALLNQTSYLFKKSEVATVETVTRVVEGSNDASANRSSSLGAAEPEAVATRLVDSDHNEYILSNPTDQSRKTVDSRLILDLGIVIISSAIGGLIAALMQQPPLLGYLLAGSAIGPGGLRLIGQFVQVETLAEFGATFLLFALGVEFSVGRLRRVRNIAVGGGGLSMVVIVGLVGVLGWGALGLSLGKGLFIGAVLSMSSTTVVVKSLMERRGELDSRVGQVMLGLLIVQDIALSLLLSIISLASSTSDALLHDVVIHLLKFVLLACIVVCCAFLWPLALRMLDYSRSHDLFLLGLVALCVSLTVVADKIIGSAEVGAFLAGILVSSSPTASVELTKRSLRLFEPIRDMFGALFFSSMGMLINPLFLLHNWKEVMVLVALTVLMKAAVTFAAMRLFKVRSEDAAHVALCLSQIGEFAFVLASQGLRAGLLQREDYMLLLGVTAVSIFITPGLIGGSFLLRRSLVRGAPDGEGKEVGFDASHDERQTAALHSDGGRGAEERERREKERADDPKHHRKDKSSDAEHHWARSLHAPHTDEERSSSPRRGDSTAEDDDSARPSRSLTATYPLKRQASRERAVLEPLEEDEADRGAGGGWRERRRLRQLERAKALADEKKAEEEREREKEKARQQEMRINVSARDERKDGGGHGERASGEPSLR